MTSLNFCYKLVQIFNLSLFFFVYLLIDLFVVVVVVVGFLLCWYFLGIVHRMWKEII